MSDPRILVASAWLAAHLHDPEVVVADVRWSPTGGTPAAEEAFARGHIPDAVFLDVDRDLAARPFVDGPGRHPLPTPESFAGTMRVAGIGDADLVICCDDVRGSVAARLWWMLDATGRTAALLDGGVQAWTGPLETGRGAGRPAAAFEVRPWPAGRVVNASDVARALERRIPVVLDARAAERYRGEVEPIDPVAGHIPGARSAPWADDLDPRTGRFLEPEAMRARYERLGVRDAAHAITSCGSGVTSCHSLFTMRLAGLGDARLYEGSWSDWIHDGARPVATGPDPG